MALKDWKLYYENKESSGMSWGREYFRKGDAYSFCKVFKTGLPSREVKRRGILPYIVSARVGLIGEEVKRYFKSRAEAIKYAESYMRTH